MNEVKYKLNREWLNELLKHKTNSNVYFSLSDNDIRILLTYIDVLQSKIDKAIEFVESMEYCGQEDYFYDNKSKDPCGNDNTFNDSKNKLLDILKEDK